MLRLGVPLSGLLSWAQDRRLGERAFQGMTGVEVALRWAGRLARRLGCLDSCLTRCLVAGSLLSRSCRVTLHLGFRAGETGVDGHAWLEIDGRHWDPYKGWHQPNYRHTNVLAWGK